jgi:adenylate kinase family enzyme
MVQPCLTSSTTIARKRAGLVASLLACVLGVMCKTDLKKIHIVGGPGSGKSYLAAKLSRELDIEHHDLDDIFWDHRIKGYGKKSDPTYRDGKLASILSRDCWIIEGSYYKWLDQSFDKSDVIVLLVPPTWLRQWRIIVRFIKRSLGVVPSRRETIRNFFELALWNQKFNNDNQVRIESFIEKYETKIVKCMELQSSAALSNHT